jgi:hypothetical protein
VIAAWLVDAAGTPTGPLAVDDGRCAWASAAPWAMLRLRLLVQSDDS